MDEIINQLITTGVGLGLLGATYLVWLLTGVANNLFSAKKWSWKRFFEDILKTTLMAIAILAWVVVCNSVNWFALRMGADLTALLDGANVAGVIGGILGGTVFYLSKAYKNILNFINTSHTIVDLQGTTQDYDVVADKTKEIAEKIYESFHTPSAAVRALQDFEEEKSQEENNLDGGKGVYYNVPHDTYDAFRGAVMGKGFDIDGAYGWQCLTAGHFVSLADGGYIDVKDLTVGDRVLNYDGSMVNNIVRIIKRKEPVVRFRTNTNDFISTVDHKVFRANGEKCSIQDLKKKSDFGSNVKIRYDELMFPSQHIEGGHNLTDDELRWLGFWLGDGTKKYRWGNSTKPEAFITVGVDKKYEYLDSLDVDCIQRKHSNGKAKTYHLVNQNHPELCKEIAELENRELRREWNAHEMAMIIDGYCHADGFTHDDDENIWTVSSTCKPLLLAIQYGCYLNNWHAHIREKTDRKNVALPNGKICENPKPYWQMYIRKDKEFVDYYVNTSEIIGEEDIYVISTDGDHSYIADNNGVQNCYDLAGLLWQQIGRWLSTGGTGAVRGCWTVARQENAGNDFTLITDKNNIKRGDVVVFNSGTYGHIGFADENYNGGAYIKLLGQNQGGTPNPAGGAATNVINMSLASFLGAFRLKTWNILTPTPKPAPEPSSGEITYVYKKGDTFGQVICDLGLKTSHGLWGADGDVAFYTRQLNEQGIHGNIPIGTTVKLTARPN